MHAILGPIRIPLPIVLLDRLVVFIFNTVVGKQICVLEPEQL